MNRTRTASSNRKQGLERFSPTLASLHRNLADTGRGYKQVVAMHLDALVIAGCLWAAYSLRFGNFFSDFKSTWYFFVLLPVLSVGAFSALGVYKWVIRSANRRLFNQLFKACAVSAFILLTLFFLLPAERANPRSLFLLYGLLAFFGTCGTRVLWRALLDEDFRGEPVAIYGAGVAGQQLALLLEKNKTYRPVLFIDDDEQLAKSTVSGIPLILGTHSDIAGVLSSLEVEKVVLAIPSAPTADFHRKVQWAESLELRMLTMPTVEELMSGEARIDEIRDVSVNDILGRSEVMPNIELMSRRVTGKTVMVTGGGGSIGSELCRQVLKLSPTRLVIVDSCEANLYHITEELVRKLDDSSNSKRPEFVPLLGSVTDNVRIHKWMRSHKIDTVFHAAAYKHVPIVEAQPEQGVEVNILGTLSVLDAAISNAVSDFVLISTDKAVRPTNSMGATKRIAELVLQAKAALDNHNTRISMVRFGNVLGSSGSVVPKFKRQIMEGGPITLTHKEVTRYFMTIPEAAQLVLQASAIAEGGDVFVLDMGEPVKISDLAKTMVHLYGKRLREDTHNKDDIEIKVLGLRPGEKLYEELFLSNNSHATEVAKISSSSEVWMEWSCLQSAISRIHGLDDKELIRRELLQLAFIGEEDNHDDRYVMTASGSYVEKEAAVAVSHG